MGAAGPSPRDRRGGRGWDWAEGGLGWDRTLTGSCVDTLGSGTRPGPTSYQLALGRNVSDTCDTLTPEKAGKGQRAGLRQGLTWPRLALKS